MEIWTNIVQTSTGPKLYTYTENVNFEYGDYTCEEYIIKNLIE